MAVREDDLVRDRLLRRLPTAGESAVVLLTAPGGWGKSTILTSWADWDPGHRFCWRRLVGADDDPKRFIDRLMTAAQDLIGEVDRGSEAELTAEVWAEEVLPRLCEELTADGPVTLVFDDYHEITNREVHNIVQSLIDALPPAMSVVLSTRVDPPLRLARLRAARRLYEWRAPDLGFTIQEADALLQTSFGHNLDTDELELLVAKTEGWPAALSLAAGSLRGVDDRRSFLQNFLATDRYLVDFLAEELLAGLPAEQQAFMAATSVVPRFVTEMAEVLSGRQDTGAFCEDLERRGLLHRELDSGRIWFRYHQLVRDFLYGRLDERTASSLHRQAAQWLEDAGLLPEAIEQLITAGVEGSAGRLVAEAGAEYILRGRYVTVMNWVDALEQQGGAKPGLLLLGASAAVYDRRFDDGRTRLSRARALGLSDPADQVSDLALRTTLTHEAGRINDAAELSHQLIDLLEDTRGDATVPADHRADAYYVAALSWSTTGEASKYRLPIERCLEIATATGNNPIPAIGAFGLQAFHFYALSELERCRALVDRAFALATEVALSPTALYMHVPTMLRVLVADDETARSTIGDLKRFCEVTYSPYGTALTHLVEAHYNIRSEDQSAAAQALVVARDLLDEVEQPAAPMERYYELMASRIPSHATTQEASPGPEALTDRERQVLRAFSSDLTQREIGRELFLSFNTVKTYTRSAYRKLGVTSRSEAVRVCRQAGLF